MGSDPLQTPARRGVIKNDGGVLSLFAKSIDDYDRDFLNEQFLASLEGKAWRERDDAIRAFMHWLGYSKMTEGIGDMGKSLINGLIQDGKLESEGTRVRKA
ncbi:MAG: hypothetical protein NT080_12030 [Spirochaetes bacterium]|nr:hypothetical protein [Spirochaetota bacterium]